MRQIASCLGEYAIQVSDHASCSSTSSSTNSWISPPNLTPSSATQTSVSCQYKTTLSSSSTTQKHLLITTTWTKTHTAQALTITIGSASNPSHQISFKLNTVSGSLFRNKKKGAKQYELLDTSSKIDLFWDLSSARYNNAGGPEPVDGSFHLTILVDSELALSLGTSNKADDVISKNPAKSKTTTTTLISRREYFSGNNTLYVTKARFCEGGVLHDVLIHCCCSGGENDLVLSVCIDKKTVVTVKRLQWNFRGNQTVFLDGLLVDMMWDVHDWFFGGGAGLGAGVFLFRRRSGTESRLWLEEKVVRKEEVLEKEKKEKTEFSLVIYACKSP